VKAVKKVSTTQDVLKASRIAALSKRAGRLADQNRKKGFH